MVILVTGSTGYIGSKLVVKLAEQEHEIRLLCRKKPDLPEFNLPNIKIFKGDITDAPSLEAAMEGADQVYHLAAYARLWAKDSNTFHHINVTGTENVLAAARKAGIKKMVYTSTAGVIGPSASKPMTEDDPRITGFFNLYEETKTKAEEAAMKYAKEGLDVSIVNPARVYGPGFDTGSNPVTKIMELYMRRKWHFIPGSGEDIGSYCYIDDVVDGHLYAMQKGRGGHRYIFGGVNATFNELIRQIKKHSGIEKKLWNLPFPVLKAVSHGMSFYSRISGKAPMITPDWAKRYDYQWELDSSKAVNELGYNIRPLEEGVKQTVAWIKTNRL
jgi:nucleoside-diphosphate-sugar epimerase